MIAAMLAMPRLPTVMATRLAGPNPLGPSSSRASCGLDLARHVVDPGGVEVLSNAEYLRITGHRAPDEEVLTG